MKMRWKPRHGEKFKWGAQDVVILKVLDFEHVNVILPNGKTAVCLKKEIELPIIETLDYEKIQ